MEAFFVYKSKGNVNTFAIFLSKSLGIYKSFKTSIYLPMQRLRKIGCLSN